MMEDQRGLFIAFRLPKIVAHYEDDVNVIWVWLSGDITAKDNEAFRVCRCRERGRKCAATAWSQAGAVEFRDQNERSLRQAKPDGRRPASHHNGRVREA